jgi:trehalose 6-phosphate synthase/phosphatase
VEQLPIKASGGGSPIRRRVRCSDVPPSCNVGGGISLESDRPTNRLVIASNRLPVQLDSTDGTTPTFTPSSGGLVSALRGIDGSPLWVGWPGAVVDDDDRAGVVARLEADGLVPVFLDADDEERHYNRISNAALWPLFHYLPSRFTFSHADWDRYVAVNQRFAETIAARCAPGGRVWVHDFQLMLVPEAVRSLRPDVSIGFFLHIPFPSSEMYRLLPARQEILRGLLGADYIGFHVDDYVRHFRSSCLRVLGIESKPEGIDYEGRTVRLGANPIGIDVASFRERLADPETAAAAAEIEGRYAGRRLILGVERLDYSKGVPAKLRAFERLLEMDPGLADTTTLLQIVVPSRLETLEYRDQRDEIEGIVSRLNGQFGSPGQTPLEYLHRSVTPAELVALYRRADVMAVTPLRDGMNLVAQEFVLCQSAPAPFGTRHRGSLVLSELAGAAQVLPGALLVNPWDVDDTAGRMAEALRLDPEERRRRLGLMGGRVARLDSRRWAQEFLADLGRATRRRLPKRAATPLMGAPRAALETRLVRARRRTFFLDYDGTLRELTSHPDLAKPTGEILDLLTRLAALPRTDVHVVSGRGRDSLARWLGRLPIHLSAEHGYYARRPGGSWETTAEVDLSWLPRIHRLFRRAAEDVPGTLTERKSCAVTWHYRQAEPEYGAWRANELLLAVEELLRGTPAEVILGHRVIEVRAQGVSKGEYARRALPGPRASSHVVVAAGDDRTDLDLYDGLPAGAVCIHVGPPQADPRPQTLRAMSSLANPAALRLFLNEVAAAVEEAATP